MIFFFLFMSYVTRGKFTIDAKPIKYWHLSALGVNRKIYKKKKGKKKKRVTKLTCDLLMLPFSEMIVELQLEVEIF